MALFAVVMALFPVTFELAPYSYGADEVEPATALRRVDPVTLRPLGGRVLRLRQWADDPLLSPDRRVVALAGERSVVLVDLVRRRILPPIFVAGDRPEIDLVEWPQPRILTAVACDRAGKQCLDHRILVLDPRRRRARHVIHAANVSATYDATTSHSVFLVDQAAAGIVPPRLIVVDRTGRVRRTTLARLRTGSARARFGVRSVAAALATADGRAFVVQGHRPVAIVDLATLRVRYRRVALLDPPSGAMRRAPARRFVTGTAGPSAGIVRSAWSLGRGRILVTGSDSRLAGRARVRSVALHARILDTRTWGVRALPATYAQAAGGIVILPGRGNVLVAGYDRRARLRWRIPKPPYRAEWVAAGARVYVGGLFEDLRAIYDARSGRLLARTDRDWIQPEIFRWTPP